MVKSDDSFEYVARKEEITSMAERLRVRTGKKPSYKEHDEDEGEDEETTGGDWKKHKEKCGFDVSRSVKASRTKEMYPLGDVEKILDCQNRPVDSKSDGLTTSSSTSKPVKQYLVKWKSMSYLHCSWVPYDEFEKVFKVYPGLRSRINNFHRQMESNSSEEDWVPIRPEWTTVDRVIASRWNGDLKEYLVKWKELSYEECTWEAEDDISAFRIEIERFNAWKAREKTTVQKKRKGSSLDGRDAKRRRKDFEHYEQTPEFLSGGSLHPYQLEGLNFLRFSWANGTHVILADEMGLGKTVQSIAFLASLAEENVVRPYLVVAPLSTLRNWEREFATWAPHMNVIMYVGSAQARSVIRQYEFFFPKKANVNKKKRGKRKLMSSAKQSKEERTKFDVLLTSYEMINMDTAALKQFRWECLIVDEGHRLKNKDSKLFQTLKQYSAKHRVLLTGTPLQNNLDELFMLMHFLDAGKFASLDEFQQEFRDISQEEQVLRLHKMLAPHLLRRVKKDVIKDLPPKKELILRVELSSLQKEYYKAILTRNYQILARKGASQISLSNVVMELRKVCAHPYMLEGVEPVTSNTHDAFRQLLEASGKLSLLDKMMVRLKDQGHRVLIYSQFKNMLDILEDYLIYKNWGYERIDGSVSGVERQIRIDRFNSPNSSKFCFILSTRAGGLGINLATADTVIIYDSDWNPHADLQAMARAHRLGQTNKVMIFRLVNRGTIDERMMQMTKKKMILEHVVVGRMKSNVLNQEELDDILRYGAKELFAEESDEASKSRQIHYDDAAIDRLLDRSQIVSEDAAVDDEEENGFLKAFKVANFEYIDEEEAEAARAEEARKQAMGDSQFGPTTAAERAQYWDDLLKDKYEEQQIETFSEFGKGKRCRKQVVCAEDDDLAGLEDISSDDEEEDREADWEETETSASGRGSTETYTKKAQSSRKRARVLPTNTTDPPPLMEGEGKSFKVLGFTQNQRATFVQILMRFGLGDFNWSEFILRMKQKTPEEIKEYGTLFLKHIAEDITDSPTFSDGVPKEGLRIQDVLVRLAILHLIRDKVKLLAAKPGTPLFNHEIYVKFPSLVISRFWKEEHDSKLLQAILKHGYGRWHAIADDHNNGFQEVIKQELQIPSPTAAPFAVASNIENGVNSTGEAKGLPVKESFDSVLDNQVRSPIGDHAPVVPQGGEDISIQTHEKNQLHQVTSAEIIHFREVQRRLVEFIRKRVALLEKALNAEYHMQTIAEQRDTSYSINGSEQEARLPNDASQVHQPPLETGNHSQTFNSSRYQQGIDINPMNQSQKASSSFIQPGTEAVPVEQMQRGTLHLNDLQMETEPANPSHVEGVVVNEPKREAAQECHMEMEANVNKLHTETDPVIEQHEETTSLNHLETRTSPVVSSIAPEELLNHAVDSESNRLELVRFYNEMCKIINENEQDWIQTYNGNKSAGSRLRRNLRSLQNYADEVKKILKGQPISEFGIGANHSFLKSDNHTRGESADAQPHDFSSGGGIMPEVYSDNWKHFMPAENSGKESVNTSNLFSSTTNKSTLCSVNQAGHEVDDPSEDLLSKCPNGAAATILAKDVNNECVAQSSKKIWDSGIIILDD